jgi:glycosyltransferase involved in cell wall biosynthesis
MILLIRANDTLADSRVQKYLDLFLKHNIPYKVLAWDRSGELPKMDNYHFYRLKTGYNMGLKSIIGRLRWMFFVISYLIKYKKSYSLVHACDLDAAFPSAVANKLTGKAFIFDIFDWFTDTIVVHPLLRTVINRMELWTVCRSVKVIICEPERIRQMDFEPKELWILPNIPTLPIDGSPTAPKSGKKRLIAYVGGLYHHRALKELLECIPNMVNLELHFAGYGDKQLEELAINQSNKYKNVIFYGKVPYSIGLEIMLKADFLYAMYCKTNPCHIYAAPNKFYESLKLAKPLITTEGTIVGEKVKKAGTGIVIGESAESIRAALNYLSGIDEESYFSMSKNCRDLWIQSFSTFVDTFFSESYLPFYNGYLIE